MNRRSGGYGDNYNRRPRQFDEDEKPFEEDVEALGKLSKRHRENSTNEHNSTDIQSFSEFPLHPTLLEALENLGYKTPFDIQTKTLTHTLEGRDVVGQAVTGSGKTLAFSIPIIQKIRERFDTKELADRSPRAIVVAPTRELCNQIYRSIQELDSKIRCVALYGGDSYTRQERELFAGVDVVCATPGRLNDHLQRRNISLNKLKFLCLDEADELLNPNFREQIESLFRDSPPSKQVLMFSATMPDEIKSVASRYLKNPEFILVGNNSKAPLNIEHQCICAPNGAHLNIVAKMISELNADRCIVFLKTKAYCDIFANNLRRFGHNVESLHSDLTQSKRGRILSGFRMGHIKILCATDVAARGLDIPEVDVVFQVEPPANGIEYYIHRSGRTGRAGRKGLAVLLHNGSQDDLHVIRQINKLVKLNHVTTKDGILDELKEDNLNNALRKLNNLKITDKDMELVTPIAEKMLASEDHTALLSRILTLLSRNSSGNFPSSDETLMARSNSGFSSNRPPRSFSSRFSNERNSYARPRRPSLYDIE
ncbi:Nucleolar RNA helicase 2, variant 3 [Chamberlinius hualienensis]